MGRKRRNSGSSDSESDTDVKAAGNICDFCGNFLLH